MPLLKHRTLPFRSGYLAIAGVVVLFLVLSRSMSLNEGLIQLSLNHLILQLYYYTLWGLLIFYINGSVVNRIDLATNNRNALFSVVLAAPIIILSHFIFSNLLFYLTMLVIKGRWTFELSQVNEYLAPGLISRTVDMLVIVTVLKLMDNYRVLNEKNIRVANLEKQMQETQLAALKAQLNPHFLFNSLHAVSSLIGYDDTKARNMTIKISQLLRKMLEDDQRLEHTLAEELDYLQGYLDIEKERFHDRLSIDLDVEEKIREAMIPKLLLQPLIENAFKHGLAKHEGPGYIRLSIKEENNLMHIFIENSTPDRTSSELDERVGLTNLRNRLLQTYSDKAHLKVAQEGKRFSVSIKIPRP